MISHRPRRLLVCGLADVKQCASFQLTNVPMDGRWAVVFNGDNQKYSSLYKNCGASQDSVMVSGGKGSLQLPEYSMVVLSFQG